MFYAWWSGPAEDYRYDVEAKGSVFDFVRCKKITGRSVQPGFFGRCDDRLDGLETLIGPGFDLDKDNSPVGIDHDEVDFAGFSGEVSGQFFEPFCFEESLRAFFSPAPEFFTVGQELASVWEQSKQFQAYHELLGTRMLGVSVSEFDGLSGSLAEKIEFCASGFAASNGLDIDDIW